MTIQHPTPAYGFDVAVVGATGLVGRTMIAVLQERRFPVRRLLPFASARSAGSMVEFGGRSFSVQVLTEESLRSSKPQIAIFSAGASVSKQFAPVAAEAGALVIDNSSAFRMDPEIPLVVPEVNGHLVSLRPGIIANPNCSTIQMVVVLKPLHDRYRIRRIVVATYQSVTGAGQRGLEQLHDEVKNGGKKKVGKFPHPIAFNLIPQIDEFLEDGSTKEEQKMMRETVKIMDDPSIRVSATCVRVPVTGGHSESVAVEFDGPIDLDEIRNLLHTASGIIVVDEPARDEYPMPIHAGGRDEVFVGRIRRDPSVEHGLNLWIVADNLRKGAATNAVQIAELAVRKRQ